MRKLLYIGAALLTFAAAGAASRSDKAQVVIRTQENGAWQMFVFGPVCPAVGNMQVIYPKDPTQPIEIECDRK
jgi:hypothetical protein